MELTHLKSFLTVARKGNLSAAAKELHMTQPNLGRQMTALSKEVGIELFIRHPRGVELTKQGQKFLELCLQIVGQLEQGTTLIREIESEPEGTLKFLTGIGSLVRILKFLPTFSQKYPNLHLIFPETINILTLNSGIAMRAALINGLGIGCYGYDQSLIEKDLLVDVFPNMPDQKVPYYYTYHKRLEGSPKIQAFHEFLKEIVKVWVHP